VYLHKWHPPFYFDSFESLWAGWYILRGSTQEAPHLPSLVSVIHQKGLLRSIHCWDSDTFDTLEAMCVCWSPPPLCAWRLFKQKIIRYHHSTVLLCSWFGHITFTPALYFVSINFSVHSIMYFYYFLMAVGAKPKWFNPMWITVIQVRRIANAIAASSCFCFFLILSLCIGWPHISTV